VKKAGVLTRMARAVRHKASSLFTPVNSRGWWPLVREPYAGAWQRNDEWTVDTVLAHHAVYACMTLISNDIGKLRTRLVKLDKNGIWVETASASFSPVLRKPNRYQNHIQFKQWWIMSKLVRGNTYVLKERDERNIVVRMYLLDPSRVTVLVAPDGGVYYQLSQDNMGGGNLTKTDITVPASEIIHDRMNCLFHPLVGVSPLFASGMAASGGLQMQADSKGFYTNGAKPSGILTAPGAISQSTADELKAYWTSNFTGANAGKIAVVGDGLKFEPMRMTAVDSQFIEQLEWTAKVVCSTFHVPPFKIGIETLPAGQKVGDMNQIYYSDCLQSLIEEMECCLDEGLGLDLPKEGVQMGVELDLDNLLRMDGATQADVLVKLTQGSINAPNESRKRLNLPPIAGGDTVYLQQQNYSLEALAKRDSKTDPFGKEQVPAAAPTSVSANEEDAAEEARAFLEHIRKGLECCETN